MPDNGEYVINDRLTLYVSDGGLVLRCGYEGGDQWDIGIPPAEAETLSNLLYTGA